MCSLEGNALHFHAVEGAETGGEKGNSQKPLGTRHLKALAIGDVFMKGSATGGTFTYKYLEVRSPEI